MPDRLRIPYYRPILPPDSPTPDQPFDYDQLERDFWEIESAVNGITIPESVTISTLLGAKGWYGGVNVGVGQTALSVWGGLAITTSGTLSKAIGTDGPYVLNTAGVAGSTEGYMLGDDTTAGGVRRRFLPQFLQKWSLGRTTNVRVFIGLMTTATFYATGAPWTTDDPTGPYVGLQYSTVRGDANWQFVAKDGVTQELVDSGVAADTGTHYLIITGNNTTPSFTVALYDGTLTAQASKVFTAHIPATDDDLKYVTGLASPTVGAATWVFYYCNYVQTNL